VSAAALAGLIGSAGSVVALTGAGITNSASAEE